MKRSFKKILGYSPYSIYETFRDKKNVLNRNRNQQKLIKEYLESNNLKKLQIGSGGNYLKGWLNTDLNHDRNIIYLDASKKFPIPDKSFQYIFSEHLFEHLTVVSQLNMLQESYRILETGGVMRIATPSLEFLFGLYLNPNSFENKSYIDWAIKFVPKLRIVGNCIDENNNYHCYVINNFLKDWGHQMIHNFSSIKSMALQIGFSEVRECSVNKSGISHLCNIEKHGTVIPPRINLLETMVVEIVK